MAIVWGASGTARVSRAETAQLTGTASVAGPPEVYVSGTATVNRASVAAWAAQARRTATRVLLGEDAEELLRVHGDVSVEIDEGSLIATASFVVTDPRCAFFHADSIVTGGIPVTIRVRITTDTAEADTSVFRGTTEAAPSTGTHVPTATIQCAGEGAEWYGEKGCLYLSAFAGYTRLEAFKAFCESVGIAGSRVRGGEEWRAFNLGLDLSGLSPAALLSRFETLEDTYSRLDGEYLDIIPARLVVGPEAQSVFDFRAVRDANGPGNYFSCSETPPNRPVSSLVLSTVGIPEEILTGGSEETTAGIAIDIAPDGARTETITTTTTVNGVKVRQSVEVWKDAAIPGVTPSAVAWRLWKLTEFETTWGTVSIGGVSLRTARVDSERTTVREWFSPSCRASSGSDWSDGTHHLDASATWQVTEDQIISYTYEAAPSCVLSLKTTNVGGWYSELVGIGETYPDGSIRADVSYQWIAPDAAQPYKRTTEASSEETGDALKAVSVSRRDYGWQVPPLSTTQVEEWRAMSGRDDRWSSVPGSGVVLHAWTDFELDGSQHSDSAFESSLPQLARAAADIPQYRTRPLVLRAAASASGASTEPQTDPVWGAESIDPDLMNVARRRFREARSPRFTIRHPANPHLRKYDVVTVTDSAWQLDAKKGYVASMRPTFDTSRTGKLVQETVIVFPLPEYDPGVPITEAA